MTSKSTNSQHSIIPMFKIFILGLIELELRSPRGGSGPWASEPSASIAHPDPFGDWGAKGKNPSLYETFNSSKTLCYSYQGLFELYSIRPRARVPLRIVRHPINLHFCLHLPMKLPPLTLRPSDQQIVNYQSIQVSAERFELSTNGLKGHCSAVELRALDPLPPPIRSS